MDLSVGTALGHQKGHRQRPRSWASVWSLVATQDRDISTDSGCGRTTDPDIILVNSPGPDVIVSEIGIADCPDQLGPSDSVNPKHQHVTRWQPRPKASTKPSMAARVTYFNSKASHSRATDPDN